LKSAGLIGKITHLDPRSVVSGIVQAHAICQVLQGVSREGFIKSLIKVGKRFEKTVTSEFPLHDKGSLISKLEWIDHNKYTTCDIAYQTLGCSSVVMQSYPFALFMFQKFWDKPFSGLIETINYGGDCDTTGAICGALYGAKNGMIFPDFWIDALDNLEKLKTIGEELYGLQKKK